MTTYSAIASGELDADSPVTDLLMLRLSDNPIATAEGSTGAPVLSSGWHPFDMVNVGDGATGEVWSFAADGAVASIVFDFSDNKYDYLFRWAALSASATSTLRLQGVAFSGTLTGSDATSGYAEILNPNVLNMPKTAFINFRLIAGAAGPTGNTTALTFAPSGGTFDAGAVYLYRRRSFIVA
jgi:hypothetical protein